MESIDRSNELSPEERLMGLRLGQGRGWRGMGVVLYVFSSLKPKWNVVVVMSAVGVVTLMATVLSH